SRSACRLAYDRYRRDFLSSDRFSETRCRFGGRWSNARWNNLLEHSPVRLKKRCSGPATTATIRWKSEGGEDDVKDNPSSPRFHPNRVQDERDSTQKSVFRALFLVFLGFAVLA